MHVIHEGPGVVVRFLIQLLPWLLILAPAAAIVWVGFRISNALRSAAADIHAIRANTTAIQKALEAGAWGGAKEKR